MLPGKLPSFRKILVVNHESREGASALRYAIDLALEQFARLVVLTVIPVIGQNPHDAGGAAVAAEIESGIVRHHQTSVGRVPAELGVESRIAFGSPRRRIREACESCGSDLLVVPDLVRRGILDRLVIPNLAGAARACDVPVVMIGARAVQQSRGGESWASSPASLPEGPERRIAIHNAERALR